MRLIGVLLLFAATCGTPLPGQFINRATWLGVDAEEVRRPFRQGTEYYLDRFSYVVVPPWWDRDLDVFASRLDYRFGSVTATSFTVEGSLNHAVELEDGWRFRYAFLQSENRDARFVRNAVGFDHDLSESASLFVQGEMFAEKGDIDVSLGCWLFRNGISGLRIQATAVDVASGKDPSIDYQLRPFALMVSGAFGDAGDHRLNFELGGQLPFRVHDAQALQTFELQRWIGSMEGRLRVAERDWLIAAAELEWTGKQVRPDAPASPLLEDLSRDLQQVRLEWWRDLEPLAWSTGLIFTHVDEIGRRPNDPLLDTAMLRTEWMAVGRLRWPVDDRLSFEPQVYAAYVRLDDLVGDGAPPGRRHGFQGKLNWNTRWDFSPTTSLSLVLGIQLDELAFGGGGAQFVSRF